MLRSYRFIDVCCIHWRELALACALMMLAVLAVTLGAIFGNLGWRVDNFAIESFIATAEESLIPDGPGELATEDGDAEDGSSFYVVEDTLTGEAIIHARRGRDPSFKRWTRYKVLDDYELSGRLVAGLKESKSIVIRVQPRGIELPDVEQLQEIAQRLRSREHHSTYVYFFLPGMDLKQNPWSTVFQQSSRPTSVAFDKTNVPAMYQGLAEQAVKVD